MLPLDHPDCIQITFDDHRWPMAGCNGLAFLRQRGAAFPDHPGVGRAALRASARETVGYPPRPRFLRSPSMLTRWNQYLVPESSTRRLRPLRLSMCPFLEPTERKPRKGRCAYFLKSTNPVLSIPLFYRMRQHFGGFLGIKNGHLLLKSGREWPRVGEIHDVNWRRGRDSNPRYPRGVYRFSRPAPSTTRPPLRIGKSNGHAARLA